MADKIAVAPIALNSGFPAAHLFTSYYPLGCLTAYAKVHAGGMLQEAFHFHPIRLLLAQDATGAAEDYAPDLRAVFLLSSYTWNHAPNLEFARVVKERCPRSLIVFGGPHIPRRRMDAAAFLSEHPFVDVLARGEGEAQTAEILEKLSATPDLDRLREANLDEVAGLTFRGRGGMVQTEDRARIRDLSILPSPYLSGEFEPWFSELHQMIFETTRGCPYGCTFCDWGAATLSKVHQVSLERVFGEIEFAGRRKVGDLLFVDANLGILPRDVEIVRHVVATKERYGYPRTVTMSNAKVATPRLREIATLLYEAGLIVSGQISMQTTDERTLGIVRRSNIKTAEYDKLMAHYRERNMPISSEMMVGLPGQNVATCKSDLQFFFDRFVIPAIYLTVVMPNAPMGAPEYRAEYAIQTDENGYVKSTFSFDERELREMLQLCLCYYFLVKLGVARSLLYFMQVERGVPAIDFIDRWRLIAACSHEDFPTSKKISRELINRKADSARTAVTLAWSDEQAAALLDNVRPFYAELLELYRRDFGVSVEGSDVDAIIETQVALMPTSPTPPPTPLPVGHDVSGYFADLRRCGIAPKDTTEITPLVARGGSEVVVSGLPRSNRGFQDFSKTHRGLEWKNNVWP